MTRTHATLPPIRERLRRLDWLSRLLDTAFPIPDTHFRIGLDGPLGIIPGIGDPLGAVLASYIIVETTRLGAPKRTLVRMLRNVTVDSLVGAVPLFGDIFDIIWKANVKNVALLRAHQEQAGQKERSEQQVLW
jgi:hypothetical protein